MKQTVKQELAEDRTDWARERTLLAKERTFSAWVRTGFAAMATGLGVARLLAPLEPEWLVRVLGGIFITLGAVAVGFGFWSYHHTLRQLEEEGTRGIPFPLLVVFSLALITGAGIALTLIVMN